MLLGAFQAIEGLIAIFEAASALPGAHIGSARRAHANDLIGIGAESLRSKEG